MTSALGGPSASSDVAAAIVGLPGWPGDGDEPVFAEGWQAEAFALVVALTDAGVFSWSDWSMILAEAIAAAQRAGDPDRGDTYYHHWVAALEALCRAQGLVSSAALEARAEDWRHAYIGTPHGQPVELRR